MQISIVAAGRLRSGPELDLIGMYLKRLPWTVRIIEVEERRPLTGHERQMSEAALFLRALPAGAYLVALDESGTKFDSRGFAARLGAWQDSGLNHVAFVIGGALGLADSFRGEARELISFGRMTWPHMLVRVMLTEQLYRAGAILSSHPYHK